MIRVDKYPLQAPSLDELAQKLKEPLAANYKESSVTVVTCPDLRQAPWHLASEGICGDEKAGDVGGQPNLFPRPARECKWSMTELAKAMDMKSDKGSLLGAGCGPFHIVGLNCELAPNFSWDGSFDNITNKTLYAKIDRETNTPKIKTITSVDCALMINLYGSSGNTGPVLKISAKGRKGAHRSFTECVRKALLAAYGEQQTVSLGGVFLIKRGKTHYHIMPDFPPEEDLPFEDFKALNDWLTYHDFDRPITCLTVFHSADPGKRMGLRMEHTHCYSSDGKDAGGHYHYDLEESAEEIEYEAYFNTVKNIYRLEKPEVTLQHDLHE